MKNSNRLVFSFLIMGAVGSLLGVSGCLSRASQKSQQSSFMDPHLPAVKGPWFEGWYLRVTTQEKSYGIIVGSYQSSSVSRAEAQRSGLPGYVAFLEGTKDGKLNVLEAFPKKTRMTDGRGKAIEKDPTPGTSTSFSWIDELGNVVGQDFATVTFPNGTKFEASWDGAGSSDPWNLGPGGLLSFFREFPLHWFVETLSAPAKVRLSTPDSKPTLEAGEAHFEKNWGKSFPKSYAWFQGHGNDAQFALAGGIPFEFGGIIEPQAWLGMFRVGNESWNFSPQTGGVFVDSKLDGCKGKASVSLENLTHRIEFISSAATESFSPIRIPKEEGFVVGSEQSFHGNAQVKVFKRGQKEALADASFEKMAMEFGGNYKCEESRVKVKNGAED